MPIRLAQPADGPAISRLLIQLEYPGTEDFIQSRLAAMLADPAEILLVWVEDATPTMPPELNAPTGTQAAGQAPEPAEQAILGLLSLHFIPQIALQGDFARISYFAVDDTARSKGIGRELEEEATRLARERGCDRLEVHCSTHRTRAHLFYGRQGYTESPKYLIKRLK